jgi:hypothetical protein
VIGAHCGLTRAPLSGMLRCPDFKLMLLPLIRRLDLLGGNIQKDSYYKERE